MRSVVFEIMRFKTIEQYKIVLWIRSLINRVKLY